MLAPNKSMQFPALTALHQHVMEKAAIFIEANIVTAEAKGLVEELRVLARREEIPHA